jgi:hypothetical protein
MFAVIFFAEWQSLGPILKPPRCWRCSPAIAQSRPLAAAPRSRRLRGPFGSLPRRSGHTRAGSLDTSAIGNKPVEQTRRATSVSCSFTPFYDQNVLLPNGDVVICCMNYSVKRKIGSLIEGLFSSRGMAELHSETKRGYSDKTICKSGNRAIRYEIAPDQRQYWRASRG